MLANVLEQKIDNGFTQFELTTNLLNNLSQFNLTPVAKLVLLELSTHYNQEKNGAVVYPAIETIAEKLGVGLTATKQAIKDLISEGLIIKSKRSNVSGNYNKYVLTSKVRNTTSEQSENELSKQSKSDLFYIRTNKQEQRKEQTSLGGNVYLDDDKILYEYAKKHNALNIPAYIHTLKQTGSAAKIIKEHNKPFLNAQKREKEFNELKQLYKSYEKDCVPPTKEWIELGEKLRQRKFKN